jgi:hypothetical protein
MINDILTVIQERLQANVEPLKYIDEDWGQLDFYSDNPPSKFPAALVEIQNVPWRNQGAKSQDGTVSVSINIAALKLTSTNPKAPASQREKAASIWLIAEKVHQALHGWRDSRYPAIGVLTRTSSRRVKRDDGIRQIELLYSCVYFDASAAAATPPPVTNTERRIAVNID